MMRQKRLEVHKGEEGPAQAEGGTPYLKNFRMKLTKENNNNKSSTQPSKENKGSLQKKYI